MGKSSKAGIPVSPITERFRERKAAHRLEFEHEAFGETLYFRVLSPGERDRVWGGANKGDGERAIDLLILKAENEAGDHVFTVADKRPLMASIPHSIVSDIFERLWEYVPPYLDPED